MERLIEKDGVNIVAKLAAVAARTAPKGQGLDRYDICLASKDEIKMIAEQMRKIGDEKFAKVESKNQRKAQGIRQDWYSDAQAIENSDELLLIAVDARKVSNKHCGMCGFDNCADFIRNTEFKQGDGWAGPFCPQIICDLGIAISSAASVTGRHHVDNRMFFKVGLACLDLQLLPESNCIIGLGMSATGKNIFFDRFDKAEAVRMKKGK